MADATTSGVLGGAAQGASLGSVAGPWGTAIGAVAGGILGGVQSGETAAKQREYEKLAKSIPLVDPGTQKYLNDLRFRRQALEAGTSSLFSSQRRAVEQAQAQTDANLARTTGGSTGTLIDALLRSQTRTNTAMEQIGGAQRQMANQFLMAEAPIIADMADRRLRLQSYARDVAMTQAATMQQQQQLNTNAALATLPNLVPKTNQATPAWAMQQTAAQPVQPMTTLPVQRDALPYTPSQPTSNVALSWYTPAPQPQQMSDPTGMYRFQTYGE